MNKIKNDAHIQDSIKEVINNLSESRFIYDLLASYGVPKSSITKLQVGSLNLSKRKNEILWKNKLFFKNPVGDLHSEIDALKNEPSILKNTPRFIIVSDYRTLLAIDTRTDDTLDISIKELVDHYDFFLPWANREKVRHKTETLADIKAAERMAKLYDAVKKDNPASSAKKTHAMNVFFSRLLFCFFAEDTGIFEDGIFTDTIASYTEEDGSDLHRYLNKLFEALDKKTKTAYPKILKQFPYVNGGLFKDKIPSPKFSHRSRKILLECGELNWSSINPDIFGSMIQAVVDPNHRGNMGMHYTSVTNIMRVIEPLFLNALYSEFETVRGDSKKLKKLLERLYSIKVFDPACGSGNFLIIAYKELRRLEMKILKELQDFPLSQISLAQFYGIEIDDFAHEIAILSLWLTEHQMNVEFKQIFGQTRSSLPLKECGNIVHGNATQLDWEKLCLKDSRSEVYVFGNPPYLGARHQSDEQKMDIKKSLEMVRGCNNLDYISCWFYKAADYIANTRAKFAFVSTNSICQGTHALSLWPHIFEKGLEIYFAYQSFKWTNHAKKNAGVTCVIIGVRNQENDAKYIFKDSVRVEVTKINSILVDAANISVQACREPISKLPPMTFGSMPNDGGHLILEDVEVEQLKKAFPESKKFIKKVIGAKEYLNGISRSCIWIEEKHLESAVNIPPILERIKKVKKYRETSKREATRKLALLPYQFGEIRHQKNNAIVLPRVSSEKREYIPFGYVAKEDVILDSAQAIYNPEPYIFGVISSRMHMTWVRAVAGRLKTDYRYSSSLCYNTFPFLEITKQQMESITNHVFNVLSEREKHSEKTLSELYDPKKMPGGLKEAHRELDMVVERCYRSKPFQSDEERLEYLFKLYEKMTANEFKENDCG